jgi:mannitol/fructose-specific phosphotransferase system IIA component (Ntr-type)
VKVQDILSKSNVLIDLKAADKLDLLTQMARFLASAFGLGNADQIVQRILKRESELSTGIGYGIAIPHSRMDTTDRTCLVAARCADPIDYDAIDEKPVRLVFMMVSPTNTATEHSQILSSISKIMSSEKTRQALLHAKDTEEFLATLVDGENSIDK